MAELDVDVLEWVQAYLHETGHAEDAAQVRLAIAALEDRDRLRADVRTLAKHLELEHDEYGWSYTEDGVSVGLDLELPALAKALEEAG